MSRRACKFALLGLLSLAGLCACVAGGYGDVGVGYDAGFYEPFGYGYCCWGPGYRVGPVRDGGRGPGRSGTAFHGAPAGRGTPSIPSGARGGGSRGGGHR
jgi:hypothetical protein